MADSGDNGKNISAMTVEEFDELCKGQAASHLDILLPIVAQFRGKPVRQVAIWSLGFIVATVRDLGKADREWIAAALRKAADLMHGGYQN